MELTTGSLYLQHCIHCSCLVTPKLFMDGTFYKSPTLFQQLYTIHGYFKGQVMPFVYALHPNKNYDKYNRLLTLINEKVNTFLALTSKFGVTNEFLTFYC